MSTINADGRIEAPGCWFNGYLKSDIDALDTLKAGHNAEYESLRRGYLAQLAEIKTRLADYPSMQERERGRLYQRKTRNLRALNERSQRDIDNWALAIRARDEAVRV